MQLLEAITAMNIEIHITLELLSGTTRTVYLALILNCSSCQFLDVLFMCCRKHRKWNIRKFTEIELYWSSFDCIVVILSICYLDLVEPYLLN